MTYEEFNYKYSNTDYIIEDVIRNASNDMFAIYLIYIKTNMLLNVVRLNQMSMVVNQDVPTLTTFILL